MVKKKKKKANIQYKGSWKGDNYRKGDGGRFSRKECKVSKEEMGTWLSKQPHLWWEVHD